MTKRGRQRHRELSVRLIGWPAKRVASKPADLPPASIESETQFKPGLIRSAPVESDGDRESVGPDTEREVCEARDDSGVVAYGYHSSQLTPRRSAASREVWFHLSSVGQILVALAAVLAFWNDADEFVQKYSVPTVLAVVGIVICAVQALQSRRLFSTRSRWAWLLAAAVALIGSTAGFRVLQDIEFDDRASVGEVVEPADVQPLVDQSSRTINGQSLIDEDLRRTDYSNSLLVNVDFGRARLSESRFRNATFDAVDFTGADLCGVDARSADFRGATGLAEVNNWNYLLYDEATRWPKRFDIEEFAGPTLVWTGSHLLTCEPGDWSILELG